MRFYFRWWCIIWSSERRTSWNCMASWTWRSIIPYRHPSCKPFGIRHLHWPFKRKWHGVQVVNIRLSINPRFSKFCKLKHSFSSSISSKTNQIWTNQVSSSVKAMGAVNSDVVPTIPLEKIMHHVTKCSYWTLRGWLPMTFTWKLDILYTSTLNLGGIVITWCIGQVYPQAYTRLNKKGTPETRRNT